MASSQPGRGPVSVCPPQSFNRPIAAPQSVHSTNPAQTLINPPTEAGWWSSYLQTRVGGGGNEYLVFTIPLCVYYRTVYMETVACVSWVAGLRKWSLIWIELKPVPDRRLSWKLCKLWKFSGGWSTEFKSTLFDCKHVRFDLNVRTTAVLINTDHFADCYLTIIWLQIISRRHWIILM